MHTLQIKTEGIELNTWPATKRNAWRVLLNYISLGKKKNHILEFHPLLVGPFPVLVGNLLVLLGLLVEALLQHEHVALLAVQLGQGQTLHLLVGGGSVGTGHEKRSTTE